MLEYISYILFFTCLICVIIYMYIRLKYGFWFSQPVFHVYNINYMIYPPGIIRDTLPEKNKYTNFKDIVTNEIIELSSLQKINFMNFIRCHYLQNRENIFSPKLENILTYFIGHSEKCFISFYRKDNSIMNLKTNEIISENKIIGIISSRPLNITIFADKNKEGHHLRVYYVDYLCVDVSERKKGIAPQLIQTHHYNQSHINKNIVVSLFKREDELTGIVPLCVYSTYGFRVDNWTKPEDLDGEYKLLEINTKSISIIYDFIKTNAGKFEILIYPDMTNVIELIKTKNIFVYAILHNNEIKSCYFFRKTCIQIERGLEVLSFFASICDCDEDLFIQGFKISFWKIANENMFGFSAIENISNNSIIINNIIQKTSPLIISPTAYFFYNFAYPTFDFEKVFIIN